MKSALARWAAAAALSASLGGCKFVGATDHNLRELHNEEGMHQRTGRLLTHYGYATRVGLMGLFQSFGAKPNAGGVAKIEDPLAECVDALNELANFDSSNLATRALQVEQFSRLAVDDPWQLSREIAVGALGEIGPRLGLGATLPAKPTPPFATSGDVQAAMLGLVRAVDRIAKGEAVIPTVAPAEKEKSAEVPTVDAACATLESLAFNVESASRVLRLASILQASRIGGDARMRSVVRLRETVERRCVEIALLSALKDESPAAFERMGSDPGWGRPRVQAAAAHACVRVWGAPMLAELLLTATPRDASFARLVALMQEVARVGLPAAPESVPADRRDALQHEWKRFAWVLATDHPDGEVRVAAYAALARIRGLARASIREEEWLGWARETGLIEAAVRPAVRNGASSP